LVDRHVGQLGWQRKVDLLLKKLDQKSKQKPGETEAGRRNRSGVEGSMDGGWQGGYRWAVLWVAKRGEKHKEKGTKIRKGKERGGG